MAPKLNQIIAVEKGIKSRSFQDLTEAHHQLQKQTVLSGISRTYGMICTSCSVGGIGGAAGAEGSRNARSRAIGFSSLCTSRSR